MPARFRSVRAALESTLPAIQRVAAEALGRIGDAAAVPDLLAASASEARPRARALADLRADRNRRRRSRHGTGLTAASARTRRAALIALDQMTPPALEAATVVPLLDSPDAVTNKTAWWIAGHHPRVGRGAARLLRPAAGARRTARPTATIWSRSSRNSAEIPPSRSCLASLAADGSRGPRLIALRVMAASHGARAAAALGRAAVTGARGGGRRDARGGRRGASAAAGCNEPARR